MSSKVLKYMLQQDTVDRTPADVIAANPPNTFLNNLASSVPAYLYQSLKTIWVGASATTAYYQNKIVEDVGSGKDNPAGSIVISSARMSDQAFDPAGYNEEIIGATVSLTDIILKKPNLQLSTDQILNASFRVQYVLDLLIRGQRGLSQSLPDVAVQQDLSIDSVNYQYFCSYRTYPYPVAASEETLVFICNYIRLFTR